MTTKNHDTSPIRVHFVCLGNICRSPLAHGVFQQMVEDAGLQDQIEVESSGTGSWHIGDLPDQRMRQTAGQHGVSLENLRGRQFGAKDLADYDHIFVMDKSNLRDVLALDRKDQYGNKVRLFREVDPEPGDYQVPDPYYGGAQGFENVYMMVERTARTLLEHLIEEYDLVPKAST